MILPFFFLPMKIEKHPAVPPGTATFVEQAFRPCLSRRRNKACFLKARSRAENKCRAMNKSNIPYCRKAIAGATKRQNKSPRHGKQKSNTASVLLLGCKGVTHHHRLPPFLDCFRRWYLAFRSTSMLEHCSTNEQFPGPDSYARIWVWNCLQLASPR
jgi:hypothetical protein